MVRHRTTGQGSLGHNHAGKYYSYEQAAMTAGPVQGRIPLIVAANAPRALDVVAAQTDGWTTFPGTAPEDEFRAASVKRIERLERSGRPLRRILLAYSAITPWSSVDGFRAMVADYAAIGFDEIGCHAPKPEERAVFDQVVPTLADYRD
ncbi:LLM class flavin-dependent oxidoreductase [Kribbella deserti]|uniref:LLM class flavin-dependent oxidoreductase n=1 Tax=Kribbella deserti TaxID=1926257 RepID=A0ABV6QWT4_9ACTN